MQTATGAALSSGAFNVVDGIAYSEGSVGGIGATFDNAMAKAGRLRFRHVLGAPLAV
jgi:hypothetical protein